jgi:ADP-heptose:LPS heptosyltransferase
LKLRFLKLVDMLLGKLLCIALGFFDHALGLTPKDAALSLTPKRVLVLRPGGLGDFVYLLPTLKALKRRFPGALVHVLAEKRNQPAAALTDAIDDILAYDVNPLRTIVALVRGKYDVVIDSEQFHNFSAVLGYITRAPTRIGFKTNPFRNHLYTHLIDYSLKGHEIGEFAKLLAPFGIATVSPPHINSFARDRIQAVALPLELANYVVVGPRGGERYRHWDSQKYAALVDFFAGTGRAVVLVGGRAETALVTDILRHVHHTAQVQSLVGKTSLLQLSRLLLQCDVFFGCDSGVAVLAGVLAPRSVGLFGSTDDAKWALTDDAHVVVRTHLPCSPCHLLGNYKFCQNIDCMARLSADEVVAAAARLVASKVATAPPLPSK